MVFLWPMEEEGNRMKQSILQEGAWAMGVAGAGLAGHRLLAPMRPPQQNPLRVRLLGTFSSLTQSFNLYN